MFLTANADELSGKCKFFGDRPKYTLTSGTMIVRHTGDLHKMGSVGNKTVWETSGAAWIIYGSVGDRVRNVFMASGMTQTCDNYAR